MTCAEPITGRPDGNGGQAARHVVAYDYGLKRNQLRLLAADACRVTVVPAATPADEVLALKPDGVFLSNGPGDPAAVAMAIESLRALLGRVPVFGICLGHQILALALGGETYKLKFGHRGGNQPVKNLADRPGGDLEPQSRFCRARRQPAGRRGGHARRTSTMAAWKGWPRRTPAGL